MEIGRVNYASVPPLGYRCTGCGVHGCKLWRQYQTVADAIRLLCCDCAGKEQGKDVSDIDDDGRVLTRLGRCDQIGWCVPAVPTEEGDTFFGYTSVPLPGVHWWKRLPTRAAVSEWSRGRDGEARGPLTPEPPIVWNGVAMKEGRCPPGATCVACERLGKHLEPASG